MQKTERLTSLEEDREYLLERVEQYKQGQFNFADTVWSFVVTITDSNEASLFNLATEEIKEGIRDYVRRLEAQGKYVVYIAHVGEHDVTKMIHLLKELISEVA
ncbi:MAG: hypothetical protein WA071_14990 [Undibacterium umbellatum]|uniref:hypothetical protein n=1 Tax=Undibacterium umbellatum TaxID=2762300 RepID=UPI003BB604CA